MARRKNEEYVSPVTKFINFCKDDKVKFITSMLLIFISVLSFLGFVSYLFTWRDDQAMFQQGVFRCLFDNGIQVSNWGSKGGGLLAYMFMNLFGVPSFAFVPLFGLLGLKILHYEPVPFLKFCKHSLVWVVWSSLFLAFACRSMAFAMGGTFGYHITDWLLGVMGPVGLSLLLLIALGAIIIFTFDNALSWMKIFVADIRKHRDIRRAYRSACDFAASYTESQRLAREQKEQQSSKPRTRKTPANIPDDEYGEVDFGDDDIPADDTAADPQSLNSPVNTPGASHDSNGVGSFFRDIFSGKDYVGKEQKLEFGDQAQQPSRSPQRPSSPQEEVINEKFVIGGPEPDTSTHSSVAATPAHQSDDLLDFDVEDTRDNDDRLVVDIDAPDPNQTPVEVQPGQDQTLPQPINGENMQMEVEINHDVRVDVDSLPPYDPTAELSNYRMPPISLLRQVEGKSSVTNMELTENKTKIVNVLKDFRVQIKKISAKIGPTVTLYEITPAPGVKISRIQSLEKDIMMNLEAKGIRIIAPMPGRGTVGIEVPNKNPEIVSMESLVSTAKFQNSQYELPLVIGKTISNEAFMIDLVKCPHMLVAGATGQGKSVGLNAIIASILYKKHPSQVKFVFVDPKKVELTLYKKIEKHFLAKLPNSDEAIITDVDQVKATLNSLTVEMDNRYGLLQEAECRNLKEYNAKFISRRLNPERGHKFLPYIVLVIDEFADLIMTAGKEVEKPLARLAQLARAIGIHLIVATQRPDVKIITGSIKANFPVRVAFRTMSGVDSKTILDQVGAENLIGRGDMLINTGSEITRLQCAFIDTPELEDITKYISSQQSPVSTYELPEPDIEASDASDVDLSKRDSLFEECARIIVSTQQGSTSMLQRRLEIGYNRAGRIMDQLEAAGIVGPSEGSKPRKVNVENEYVLEQYLSDLDRSL